MTDRVRSWKETKGSNKLAKCWPDKRLGNKFLLGYKQSFTSTRENVFHMEAFLVLLRNTGIVESGTF